MALICKDCGEEWNGRMHERGRGGYKYRCQCGSQKKPVEMAEIKRVPHLYDDEYTISNCKHPFKITEKKLQKIRMLYCSYGWNIEEVCLECDLLREEFLAIKKKFGFVKTSVPVTDKELDELSVTEIVERTRNEKKRAYFQKLDKKIFEDMKKELNKYNDHRYFIDRAIKRLRDIDTNITINLSIKVPVIKRGAETMLVWVTDVHAGLTTESSINTYNIDVMKQRFKKLTGAIIREQAERKVKTLHLCDGGDKLHGKIHQSVRKESENMIDSFKAFMECWFEMVATLEPYFDRIVIHNTNGSHSSLENDKNSRTPEENMGNLFLWHLDSLFHESDTISVDKGIDGYIFISMYDYAIMGAHGDEGSAASIAKLETMYRSKGVVKEILCGHIHHWKAENYNGVTVQYFESFCGNDSFAVNKVLNCDPATHIRLYDEDGLVYDKVIRYK